MGIVTIYKETNFQGDYITLRDGFHARASLEQVDFYDQIKSLRVKNYTVANIQQLSSRGSPKKLAIRGPVNIPDISMLGLEKISYIEVYTTDEWLSGGFHPGRVTIFNREQFSDKYKALRSGFYDSQRLKSKEVRFYDGLIYSLTIDPFMGCFLYSNDDISKMPNMFILGPARVDDVGRIGFANGVRAIEIIALRKYDTDSPNRPLKIVITDGGTTEDILFEESEEIEEQRDPRERNDSKKINDLADISTNSVSNNSIQNQTQSSTNKTYIVLFVLCIVLLVVVIALLIVAISFFYKR